VAKYRNNIRKGFHFLTNEGAFVEPQYLNDKTYYVGTIDVNHVINTKCTEIEIQQEIQLSMKHPGIGKIAQRLAAWIEWLKENPLNYDERQSNKRLPSETA